MLVSAANVTFLAFGSLRTLISHFLHILDDFQNAYLT